MSQRFVRSHHLAKPSCPFHERRLRLVFKGKHGLAANVKVQDRRLRHVVKVCQDLPGQLLFQYLDDEGDTVPLTSTDVNDYLREAAGDDATAKDFRTWSGTLLAATLLAPVAPPESERDGQHKIKQAIGEVSAQLGNTPAVCRASYVHPQILEWFGNGTLGDRWDRASARGDRFLKPEERKLLRLLRAPRRARAQGRVACYVTSPSVASARNCSCISTASTASWVAVAGRRSSATDSGRVRRNAVAARTASCSATSVSEGYVNRHRRTRSAISDLSRRRVRRRPPETRGSRRCGTCGDDARRSNTRRRSASGSDRARRTRARSCPRGIRGAGNNSSDGMCAIVSTSSGAMWTNCDEVQHAVQPSHGTSASRSLRSAACIPAATTRSRPRRDRCRRS